MRKNDGSGTRDVDGQCRRKVSETRLAWRREEKERQATGVKKKQKKPQEQQQTHHISPKRAAFHELG